MNKPFQDFVIAEEDGLVSIRLGHSAKAPLKPKRCVGHRVRLNPPEQTLREDGHVFDLEHALSYVEQHVLPRIVEAAPEAVWTDTVIGIQRVTVSFGTNANVVSAVKSRFVGELPEGWNTEEVSVDKDRTSRVANLLKLAEVYCTPEQANTMKDAASLMKALKSVKSPGSFRLRAGLDKKTLKLKTIKDALVWLSGVLSVAEPALVSIFGESAENAQLGLYVNGHPRMRNFSFELATGEDRVSLPDALQHALASFFDAPIDQSRRICGVLGTADVYTIKGASRINVDYSS
jgi:hypothetical protein